MNNYSPKVGLLNTEQFLRYYENSLKQLNINYQIIDSINHDFDFFISSKVSKIENYDVSETLSGFVVTLARSKQGQIVVYPVSSFQDNEVITPASNLSEANATKLQAEAIELATKINLEGAIEVLFSDNNFKICKVNSLPTFLSLWTLDGAITSIFENHVRGLLNLPLGSPKLLDHKIVTVQVIGGNYSDMYRPFLHILARDPELRVHLYEKEVKFMEVIGHVSLKGGNVTDLLERTHHAADYLNGKLTE
jgi:5-(carboxyamino)imidazole ribonucleotide synthase